VTHPFVVAEAAVADAARITPSFVRVELAGVALAGFGVEGGYFDQRIKLVFPNAADELPVLSGPDWYAAWRAVPDAERGCMRTYSVRGVHGSGAGTRLVIDIVLHEGDVGPGPRRGGAMSS
jgi:NADPH-dependent ferric siderophore reductase